MKGILKYTRWLWSHSVGARGAILLNILLGTLTVGLNLLFIYLCKRLVDIATGVAAGSLGLCLVGAFHVVAHAASPPAPSSVAVLAVRLQGRRSLTFPSTCWMRALLVTIITEMSTTA